MIKQCSAVQCGWTFFARLLHAATSPHSFHFPDFPIVPKFKIVRHNILYWFCTFCSSTSVCVLECSHFPDKKISSRKFYTAVQTSQMLSTWRRWQIYDKYTFIFSTICRVKFMHLRWQGNKAVHSDVSAKWHASILPSPQKITRQIDIWWANHVFTPTCIGSHGKYKVRPCPAHQFVQMWQMSGKMQILWQIFGKQMANIWQTNGKYLANKGEIFRT